MLSRTANGLFWMSRYVERMENIARLLDAGSRMEALPSPPGTKATEWASILIASGCQTTFPEPLENATQANVSAHLVFDPENPSSIKQCLSSARENARAMRTAVTREVWDAINQSWTEMKRMEPRGTLGRGFPEFLEWVKARGALVRGSIDATLLRDEGYAFIQLGKRIERADATARLLDVKYHVLLPKTQDVGGGLDYLQWLQVLRAANAAVAYRHLYRRTVDAEGVVDLLVCNLKSPRSLMSSVLSIAEELHDIGAYTDAQNTVAIQAERLCDHVARAEVDAIISYGLHEWLTDFIISINALAQDIGRVYGFDGGDVQALAQQTQ
ncbi:putative alpha-E superfamily protein [Rhodovulum iodosum]|uniref:Alpha-E superfamily protein n=1 Tax=Rhodovulum iodosum TaxID=68291 RepID=A0ABV3XS80_9RHOB|nr:alpha-E domain-containing protein [Rhodovulum robiginosum]RSK30513.1 alpha-E domain-containing protein [Rhodovulum robiginosum]